MKYEGYIRRQMKQVEQFKKMEGKKIPEDLNYEEVGSLRIEARQKLETYVPPISARPPGSREFPRRIFPCSWYTWKHTAGQKKQQRRSKPPMEEKNIYDWTGFEQGLEELGISLNETQRQQFRTTMNF